MFKLVVVTLIIFGFCVFRYEIDKDLIKLKNKYNFSQSTEIKIKRALNMTYVFIALFGFSLGVLAYKYQWLG